MECINTILVYYNNGLPRYLMRISSFADVIYLIFLIVLCVFESSNRESFYDNLLSIT